MQYEVYPEPGFGAHGVHRFADSVCGCRRDADQSIDPASQRESAQIGCADEVLGLYQYSEQAVRGRPRHPQPMSDFQRRDARSRGRYLFDDGQGSERGAGPGIRP